jgi:NAD(P)-dependent dehydrogenase (short-subunit alcohol dehydrogenase family)
MTSGKVAAVSGAGSGIGRALAVGLAQRGARLSLSDVDRTGLEETAQLVRSAGADVHTAVVDVSDQPAVADWATGAVERYGVVHQVYNNAGIGSSSLSIEKTAYETFQRVLDINLWGVIHGTKEFLPHVIASGDGHVVNISSLNGIMGQAGLGPYCASKFAVRGLTETLRAEMFVAGHPVSVTVVHPGGVKTNIASTAYAQPGLDEASQREQERRSQVYGDKLFKATATDAAEVILRGVAAKRGRVLIGQATGVDRLVRLLPASYPRVVALWEKRTFAAPGKGTGR